MIEPQTKVIDGRRVTVTQLPATKGLLLLARLVRVAGPGVGRLIASLGSVKSLRDLMGMEVAGLAGVSAALASLSEHLTDAEVLALRDTLLEGAMVDDRPMLGADFETAYQGRILFLLKVQAFALEVNLRDFFAALPAVPLPAAKGSGGSH